MKISVLGNKGFDTLEYHTVDALQHLGHEVQLLDMSDFIPIKYLYNYWFSKFIPKYAEILFNKLAAKVIDFGPDIVIGTYRFIPNSCISKIKAALSSTPVVQLNPDQLTAFEKQQIFHSPYDFYFTKDPYILNFMKNKAGLNAFYLPEAFNQRVHKMPEKNRQLLEQEIDIDVVVFGSIYPYRARLVKALINADIKVTMFGNNQNSDPELKKFFRNEWITGDRKSDILIGSKIVFNNFHYAEIDSANCKFFEIAGAGGFQICDAKPTISEYSCISPDRFTFNKIDEAIELISFYLKNSDQRYEIADQQRAHFLANHTYDIRVQQMLDIITK